MTMPGSGSNSALYVEDADLGLIGFRADWGVTPGSNGWATKRPAIGDST